MSIKQPIKQYVNRDVNKQNQTSFQQTKQPLGGGGTDRAKIMCGEGETDLAKIIWGDGKRTLQKII